MLKKKKKMFVVVDLKSELDWVSLHFHLVALALDTSHGVERWGRGEGREKIPKHENVSSIGTGSCVGSGHHLIPEPSLAQTGHRINVRHMNKGINDSIIEPRDLPVPEAPFCEMQ